MASITTLTNEEIIKHTWLKEGATLLEVELAQRLEALIDDYDGLEMLVHKLHTRTQQEVGD